MIKKINIICFIFLFLFLISAVSAVENENKTLNKNLNEEIGLQRINNENDKSLLSSVYGEIGQVKPKIKVNKEKVKIKTSNINMYYKDGHKFSVSITDKNSKAIKNIKVKLQVNGKTQIKTTDSKGKISIDLNFNSGKYPILINIEGTNKYQNKNLKKTINIKSTIKCSDLNKYYKNSKKYSAKFYDKKGKLLKNTKVKFTLNSKTYTQLTDKSGNANIKINLKQGKYPISIYNLKTNEKVTKTINIKALIKENNDLTKYYNNPTEFKVKIIHPSGKVVGAGKSVFFKINGKTCKKLTDKKGYAKININLNPATYTITTKYDGCFVSNKITIKTLIQSNDVKMNYDDGSEYKVKILNSEGKIQSNVKVTLKVDGKTYTKITDKNGIARLKLDLDAGNYKIICEYKGIKSINNILVKNVVKYTPFHYSIQIPSYVNVTFLYVFSNSVYSLKTGIDGIIKMPKKQAIQVQVASKNYLFTTHHMPEMDAINIGYKSYLIPFDGSELKNDYNIEKLTGNGLILTNVDDYLQIDYKNTFSDNIEQFGVYADKGLDKSEKIIFMQNGESIAGINFQTLSYDELGLKINLAKFYGKTIYDFNTKNYNQITNNNADKIKFVNTGDSVTLSYFENYIAGYLTKEYINTLFKAKDNFVEKQETINYGLNKSYNPAAGFEFIQSYTITNEKIRESNAKNKIAKIKNHVLNPVQNLNSLYLISLNTALLSYKLSDKLKEELNVNYKVKNTNVIMSGITRDKVYLHILNPTMGMNVSGKNAKMFRFMNSLYLPELEKYCLSTITNRIGNDARSSLEEVIESINTNNYSMIYLNKSVLIICENKNSTIIIDEDSGIANVLMIEDGFAYKGSKIDSSCNFCGITLMINDVVNGINSDLNNIKHGFDNFIKNLHSSIVMSYKFLAYGIWAASSIIKLEGIAAGFSFIGAISILHSAGIYYKDHYVDEKDLYDTYDKITLTRPGYFQDRKIFNIPKSDGSVDYIEVPINNDHSLDRDNAKYISKGSVKTLTRAETYQYFDEEYYTPLNVPKKYLNKSWNK